MRLPFVLALLLCACAADPVLLLDSGLPPGDVATEIAPLVDTGPAPVDSGFDAGTPARVCTPGAQVACACVGGGAGAQVCNAAGSALGACMCPDAGTVAADAQPTDIGRDAGVDVPDCGDGYTYCPNESDPDPAHSCINLADGTYRNQRGLSSTNCGMCGRSCDWRVCCGGRCFAPDASLTGEGIPNCSRIP